MAKGTSRPGRPRIVVFGSGRGGRAAIQRLAGRGKLIAVLDNDPDAQGRDFCGVQVLPPEQISRLRYDWICLASVYLDEMASQLSQYGVALHRMRDGSLNGWDAYGMPRRLSPVTSTRAMLVGPRTLCESALPRLIPHFKIVGIYDSHAAGERLDSQCADRYIAVGVDPNREVTLLMEAGVPLDSIDVLGCEIIP